MALALDAVSDFSTSQQLLPWQRATSGTTSVSITGTYTGTAPSSMTYQLNGGGSVAVNGFSAGGNVWAGTLTSLTAGAYTLALADNLGQTVNSVIFLLGDAFLICGDSVAAGSAISGQTSSGTNHSWHWHPSTSQFFRLDLVTEVGYYPLLGTQLAADQSVPIMFLNGGASGTHLEDWASGTHPNNALALVTNSRLNKVRGVLWHIGTNNVLSGSAPQTRATTTTRATTAQSFLNATLVGPPTHIFSVFGQCASSDTDLRTAEDQVRLGLIDGADAGTWKLGAVLVDHFYSGDQIHPTNTNAASMATRKWMACKDALYSGTLGRGPRPSSITLDTATKKILRITWDQDLGNSINDVLGTCFRVMDNGSAVTVTSAIVTGPRVTTITLPSAIVGTCTVSFASNNDAVSQAVPVSAAISLPAGSTDTRPAEPIIASSVTDFAATGLSRSRLQLGM